MISTLPEIGSMWINAGRNALGIVVAHENQSLIETDRASDVYWVRLAYVRMGYESGISYDSFTPSTFGAASWWRLAK